MSSPPARWLCQPRRYLLLNLDHEHYFGRSLLTASGLETGWTNVALNESRREHTSFSDNARADFGTIRYTTMARD